MRPILPRYLALSTPPSPTVQSGVVFPAQPVIQLRDRSGRDVARAGFAVTAAIASGGGALGGTLTVETNGSGQAVFTDLTISGTVGARTLQFTATDLTPATSGALDLTAGPASQVVITTQPSPTAQSGIPIPQQPVVQLRDAVGNDVSQSGVSVAVDVATGSGGLGPPGSVATNGAGQAVFSGLTITGTVGPRTLRFTATGLIPDTSTVIDLRAGLVKQLVITRQPSGTAYSGVPLGPQPIVQLRDSVGNDDVLQSGVAVTPSVASGTGSLSPTSSVQTNANGQAVYAGLTLTGSGLHTLQFTAAGVAPDTSTTIDVTAIPCTETSPGDRDGDRLPDCVETNTGVYGGLFDAGTDPDNPDTDGDAINDGDEVLGTTGGLDLPAMGLSPLRRDILIEYDWFDDALECGSHSHRPSAGAIALVTAAFATAPVGNPDGSTGINLVSDYGQGGAFTGGNLILDADGVLSSGVGSPEFQNYKSANMAVNRVGYFHYAILPHRYNTNSASSGQAEIAGDDFIVSLYCFRSDHNVAHTIMHELGHNLDLLHGGFENTNYKPNYNSVMNYKYQFPGIDTNCTPPGDGVLSYSIGTRLTLVETNLNEPQGVCGNPPGPGWDWNQDGDALDVGVTADINVDGGGVGDGILQSLQDYDDWAALYFAGPAGAGAGVALRVTPEIISCDNPAPVDRR